jgi:hypothetical protein
VGLPKPGGEIAVLIHHLGALRRWRQLFGFGSRSSGALLEDDLAGMLPRPIIAVRRFREHELASVGPQFQGMREPRGRRLRPGCGNWMMYLSFPHTWEGGRRI